MKRTASKRRRAAKSRAKRAGRPAGTEYRKFYNARPDTIDFRDRMYEPTLVEVPQKLDLARYRRVHVPVLDQGAEGACTGFALATITHYLLRTRNVYPSRTKISPWMLYEMAKRYDEWVGTDYEGSSARGAMKGWHKHGVCRETLWAESEESRRLTDRQAQDAGRRPLGSYYRVNHKDLVAMHASLAEVGALYATSQVHMGWEELGADGIVHYSTERLGGHAFAIVGYDEDGFWIQNSWGRDWGNRGFGHVGYDDWLENGQDVWVARLAVPVKLRTETQAGRGASLAARQRTGYSYSELRPHVISLGNDGRLSDAGTYGTTLREIETMVRSDLPSVTKDWRKVRVLLYAHGGLVSDKAAVGRIAEYRTALLGAEVYPLAFVWRTDYWSTLKNILSDAVGRRRTEGWLDDTKDFMLDRLDDSLEPIARNATGKSQWDEMKENALLATVDEEGGARLVADCLAELVAKGREIEIHVAGHSAGSIFMAPLVQYLVTTAGLRIKTCTLLAPAITEDLFFRTYEPLLGASGIGKLSIYTLDDEAERDDHCAHVYHKSLLYLVSNAFEDRYRIPLVCPDGEPIIGMAKFLGGRSNRLRRLRRNTRFEWVKAPNDKRAGDAGASEARRHGDFDDDEKTVTGMLRRITGKAPKRDFAFVRSDEAKRDRRRQLS